MIVTPLTHRRSFLVAHTFAAWAAAVVSWSGLAFAAESPTRAADRDPSLQVERDWIDNRWNRTDVGSFLASNLDLPNGRIAKGLSIKVGDGDDGAVCFDTAQCTLRAGWLGGFLRFSPQRFGLIQTPRLASSPVLALSSEGWLHRSKRHRGFHVNGKRVVLDSAIDQVRVLESPWLETRGAMKVFTRTFEIPAGDQELRLAIASGEGASRVDPGDTRPRVVLSRGSNVFAAALVGRAATPKTEEEKLILSFPPRRETARVKLLLWSGESSLLSGFDEFVANVSEPENLENLQQPGSARWLPELETAGQRGFESDFLAVDTLAVPYENPWNALMFLSGVDFAPDGAAYVCSIHGDVWRVTGIDDRLGRLRWKRFATGLFQPLGLKARDGEIFVLGRDQITRLHDRNGDGEADFYENFSNLIDTAAGHSYVACLEKDDAGNFYYVDPRGVHRVSADGRKKETLATGFRNPNGLGVSPDGQIITVAPQQGEWTPSSALCEVSLNGYYGHGGPKPAPTRPLGFDPPLCWIPHSVDNSSGSQVWVPAGQWGPLGGKMLHLLWGRCGLMLVLRDTVAGVPQGAVVPLPGRFLSGPQRGSFNPRDGHLYIAASTGWQTSAVRDGALHRVRFTGKPVSLPIAWHAHANGLKLTFTQPLDSETAQDPESYAVHQWNYRYSQQYGSKDWSVASPEKEGRDEVTVKSTRLLPDGRTVFLEMPGLSPVMQMEIRYNLNAADGKPLRNSLWLTLNRLDSAHP